MAAIAITSPLPQFFDLDGSPLDAGRIYFGQVGQNPETAPVTVYWDEAATQPVAQPVTTVNGYIVRGSSTIGMPTMIFSTSAFSLTVRDSRGRQVIYVPDSSKITNDQILLDEINGLRADLANDTDPTKGPAIIGYSELVNYTVGAGAALKSSVKNGVYQPATGGTDDGVRVLFDITKAVLRYGGSDTTPQNDEKNYWRGLPSQDAWGNASNRGIYSVAFNRNGASYGSYSATFGHDCVAYGVTSLAGGAGSCAGDPDDINPANFKGYCAFAWGKNVIALGEKSTALGEESEAVTRASVAAGYFSKTGSYGGSGLGAVALGRSARAFGEGSVALGQNVQSSNGGYTIGSGVNPGTALNNTRANAVAFGTNTAYPSFVVMPGSGTGAINDVGYTEIFAHAQRYTDMLGGVTLFTCGTAGPVITNPSGGGYGGIEWSATIAGVLTSVCRVDSDTNIPSLVPTADNSRRLGSAALRWSVIFAATGTINTSDEELKEQFTAQSAAEKRVALAIKGSIRKFKFKDAVQQKGSGARWHFGVGAQTVAAAFLAEGLDPNAYGLFCKDGDRYGIRYDELAMFILAAT